MLQKFRTLNNKNSTNNPPPPPKKKKKKQQQKTTHGSSSNWILMSQPHRVTSGQSNSGHKQINISKLFSHMYQPSAKSIYTSQIRNIHTQTSDTNFRRVSLFNITPVKRAHKAWTCWYRRPFRLIYQYQVKQKYKKGMDRHNIKFKNVI